ncbi:MAG TPA: alpha-glucan family phosphorylase, partial [Myxococcota bacterium]|nr:alpha-glucan family phosphorylase [Myxococcota bacterium]
NREVRLGQYALLGIGGIRALRALGIEAAVVHVNEGHAALAAFELAREAVDAGAAREDALDAARERLVFTTHTPVAAGNETYAADELWRVLGDLPDDLGLPREEILGRGRIHPSDPDEPLGLTVLALRASRSANGVSRVHGGVARGMWHEVWPDRAVEEVPIGHVTNGVHLPTWMAAPMRELMDRYLGDGWTERAADPRTWDPVDDIPDEELWAVRKRMRKLCVDYVRERSIAGHLGRAERLASIASWTQPLSPDILTVGFARRLASYKRLHLLPHGDPARFRRLLQGDPPVQWLLAGKAHPLDDEAKAILQRTNALLGRDDDVRQRLAYVEDYDLAVATRLVAGCDVWTNAPRPPLEACGTSGMKAMLNGALNLSVLDGWWAEAYDGSNGWAIPADPTENEAAHDDRDRHITLDLFEREILPLFYDRDADGVPRGWMRRVKRSLRTNGPRFCTSRMLRDYVAEVYAKG